MVTLEALTAQLLTFKPSQGSRAEHSRKLTGGLASTPAVTAFLRRHNRENRPSSLRPGLMLKVVRRQAHDHISSGAFTDRAHRGRTLKLIYLHSSESETGRLMIEKNAPPASPVASVRFRLLRASRRLLLRMRPLTAFRDGARAS